ncbi:MAG: tetratricopeptide repeat protein, partial [Methanoregula sp.]|nr:tetratricopeptide repeat protein [Methanoregula sp.]
MMNVTSIFLFYSENKTSIEFILAICGIIGFLLALWAYVNGRKQESYISDISKEVKEIKGMLVPFDQNRTHFFDYTEGLPKLDDKEKRIILEKALQLRKEHKYVEAIKNCQILLGLSLNEEEQISLLILIGNCYSSEGDFDSALGSYKKALKSTIETNNQEAKGAAYANIGLIFRFKGEFDKALDYHNKSLLIIQKTGSKKDEAQQLGNIGAIYWEKGEPHNALNYYNQSIFIAREIQDKETEAGQLSNIGLILKESGDYTEALNNFNNALEIFEDLGLEYEKGEIFGNIGLIYWDLGDYDKTFEYYMKSYEIHHKFGNKIGET